MRPNMNELNFRIEIATIVTKLFHGVCLKVTLNLDVGGGSH